MDRFIPYPRRIMIWLMVSFVLAMLLWSFIGEIDVVVTAEGKVVADGYTKVLQSPLGGTVRSLNAREGQFVQEGAILVELDSRVHEAELTTIRDRIAQAKLELSRLEAERAGNAAAYDSQADPKKRATQEALRRSREAVHEQRQAEAQASAEAKQSALEAGQVTLSGHLTRETIAREKEEKARKYVDIAIPRFQYLQLKDELVTIQRDIDAQRRLNQKLQHELDEAKRKLRVITTEKQAELLTDINEREALITQLESELIKAEKHLADNQIKAPVAGYIQKVHVTALGATVAASDPVVVLVPKDMPLVIEAFLPNEDKGFIREGQPVDIKLDAFPFQKYGKLRGRLVWVSPDAEEWTNASRALMASPTLLRSLNAQASQLVYRAKIQPETDPQLKLAPGMTVKVDVFTDRRRIIDFFLFPLTEAVEDALRVR